MPVFYVEKILCWQVLLLTRFCRVIVITACRIREIKNSACCFLCGSVRNIFMLSEYIKLRKLLTVFPWLSCFMTDFRHLHFFQTV